MSSQRNYEDHHLRGLLDELNEGERRLLVFGGALPMRIKETDPDLRSSDVARLIQLAQQ